MRVKRWQGDQAPGEFGRPNHSSTGIKGLYFILFSCLYFNLIFKMPRAYRPGLSALYGND